MSADDPAHLKTELLRALAHAMRSPLGVLDGSLGELEGAPADDLPMLVSMARRNTSRLLQLAERLEAIAAIEAGELRVESTSLDARQAVEDALQRRGLTGAQVQSDAGVRVHADPRLLAQVLGEVLDNAERFGRGSVRVSIESLGDRTAIAVHDDGPGLGDADVEALFDRFRDGRARGCAREFATGLSLVRDYTRAMGGELTLATARPEGGACCRIELPAVPPGQVGP